jgi:3-hydroxymyristoyl/3-hydroxydecanoyl-(acyl carrier protein) dehydratase
MPSPPAPFSPLPQLPHQAPFRLVDRIVAADVARGHLVAQRRLTFNDALWPAESHNPSHFFPETAGRPAPAELAFPPTLLIEALSQAAACLNSLCLAAQPPAPPPPHLLPTPESAAPAPPRQHHGYLVAIADVKFPSFAYVGETLTLEVQQMEKLGAIHAFAVRATVTDGAQPREGASGRLLFAVTLA